MGALPKRRISTARQGKRRHNKNIATTGRGQYVGSRERRATKKGEPTTE